MASFIGFIVILCLAFSINVINGESDREIVSAKIESCRGCQLNRLPDVKKFIYEDVPLYKDVEFTPIQGAPPELILLDADDKEVERISLSKLNRKECNDLLVSKGFEKTKANKEEF